MLKITTLKVANALTTHMKEYSFSDYKSLWWELSKQSTLPKSQVHTVALPRDFLIDGRRSLIWDVRLGG